MEPVEEDEERNEDTLAQQQPPEDSTKIEGGDEPSGVDPHPAAAAGGEHQSTPAASAKGMTADASSKPMETPKSDAEPKRAAAAAAARDIDPAIELGEAFEGFASTSLPKMRKRNKKKKQKATTGPSGTAAFKIRLNTATAPASTADQAKRKAKAAVPTGLSKRPIRSAFGGRSGELALLDMPVPALTDDEIGAAAFFGPSSGAGSFGGGDMKLSDGEADDDEVRRILGDAELYAAEFENSLNFYTETHEEQDPVYAAFASAKAAERREAALARLGAEEAEEQKKFEERAKAKAQKARVEVRAKIDAVRQHNLTKQQKQREDAQAQYQEKRRHNEARVVRGQEIVVERQKKDFQKAQQALHQFINEGKISREDASRRWAGCQQQLAASASRMQAELQAKAEEIHNKADAQFALQKGRCTHL